MLAGYWVLARLPISCQQVIDFFGHLLITWLSNIGIFQNLITYHDDLVYHTKTVINPKTLKLFMIIKKPQNNSLKYFYKTL